MGRRNLRLQHNPAEVSARLVESSRAKTVHHRRLTLGRNDPALVPHHLSLWLGPDWGDCGLGVNAVLYPKVLHFLHLVLLKGDLRNTHPWLPLSTPCITQVHFFTQVQRAAPSWFPWLSLCGEKLRKRR